MDEVIERKTAKVKIRGGDGVGDPGDIKVVAPSLADQWGKMGVAKRVTVGTPKPGYEGD